jgi:hypothetical protein
MKLPTIEEQLCSLEQAKKLVKLGLRTPTIFYYTVDITSKRRRIRYGHDLQAVNTSDFNEVCYKFYPAYTVAELGVLLPSDIFVDGYCVFEMEQLGKHEPHWLWRGEEYNTEAQARAEALIWLIENDYLKAEDLNP